MWNIVATVTVLGIIVLFGLLSLAGQMDPNPRNIKPPTHHPG